DDGAASRGRCEGPGHRQIARRDQAGGGPYHLRAGRRRRMADPGPDPPLPSRARAPDRRARRAPASGGGRVSTVNIIILVVAVLAIIAVIGMRGGPRVTKNSREVVRRDENDDA